MVSFNERNLWTMTCLRVRIRHRDHFLCIRWFIVDKRLECFECRWGVYGQRWIRFNWKIVGSKQFTQNGNREIIYLSTYQQISKSFEFDNTQTRRLCEIKHLKIFNSIWLRQHPYHHHNRKKNILYQTKRTIVSRNSE